MNGTKFKLCLLISLFLNIFIIIYIHLKKEKWKADPISSSKSQDVGNVAEIHDPRPYVYMFIAVGSRRDYIQKRQEIRRTWIKDLPKDGSIQYYFFSDLQNVSTMPQDNGFDFIQTVKKNVFLNNLNNTNETVAEPKELLDYYKMSFSVEEEKDYFKDIQLMPLPSGRKYFGARGLYQFEWATQHYRFNYYLRLDDDSYPCINHILYDLQFRPKKKFLWTKYWHQVKRTRVDENFLLLTNDIIEFILMGIKKDLLTLDVEQDFGINLTVWLQFMNITIFDDQSRLDSQQAYLTNYMHRRPAKRPHDIAYLKNLSTFCSEHIYAHHVYPGIMDLVHRNTIKQSTFIIPEITAPNHQIYSVKTNFFSLKFPNCVCYSLSNQ